MLPKLADARLENVRFQCRDFKAFMDDVPQDKFLFLDPPYDIKADPLYGHNGSAHRRFDLALKGRSRWVLCYNDSQRIREDAKLTRKDIYLLMVDFSEAFDTIDHDKLLQIMYDLGFPTDATEVVKDLYTGATTAFTTPFGNTEPMPMDRGTIQGDSLSPFLFIYIWSPCYAG